MNTTKIYLYDKNATDYKGIDYSSYLLCGNSWIDDLTEEIDVAEVTLVGLSFSEEFAPTTKFIIDLIEDDGTEENIYETLCLAVANDVVTQPILSDDNYFNHAITFNEASVISQGRLVDNCSETFELKDVNINDESIYNPNLKAVGKNQSSATNDSICSYSEQSGFLRHSETITYKRKFSWVFTEEYMSPTNPNYGKASDWDNVKLNYPVAGGEELKLPIPLLGTQFGAKNSADYESYVNLCSVEVFAYESNDGVKWSEIQHFTTNPSSSETRENEWRTDWRLAERVSPNVSTKGYGINRADALSGQMQELYKRFAAYDLSVANRFITIPLQANKQYCVIVKPKFIKTTLQELGNIEQSHLGMRNVLYGDSNDMYYTYSYAYSAAQVSLTLGYDYSTKNNSQEIILPTITDDTGMPMMKIQFSTFVAGSNVSTFLKSAPALSAYDLFRDVLLKSQTTNKIVGTYIKDTPLAYYCDVNDVNRLQNAEIIESSFNQKNLWEILLEIGKYIHAIPYIEFGKDDRFVVRWRYLGQTTYAETNRATPISIFNSRSVENYICSLNSYVTNMVQKGAQVTELIAPKSESDDYLVYNDVAVLKTTKPIIELLSLSFKCVNSNTPYYAASSTEYDITKHIYEHNVYELLDVVTSVRPNKGEAIYYNLGENVIRGLNYQLPSINVGDGDTEYAIKRIIGQYIMNGSESNWKQIKINDFVFKVSYRTKEEVRSEQSRPDIRKYLINSKYEEFPHHTQFNNQQDKMVDSIKSGNQNYGKLIKTGNTEYKTTEWNDRLYDLKKAGQLVDIRGNIYYVSRAEHTFYKDYILTEITYSKDYNKLSEIIGIPSEPRFFEISEQSSVDRQIVINDFIKITTDQTPFPSRGKYANSALYNNLLFNNVSYPKFAITQIKNDGDNPNPQQGLTLFSKDFMHPLSAYSMRNTLTLKWEMHDNFSAGDRVERTENYKDSTKQVDTTYSKLLPTQYTDIYGRADLMEFVILQDLPDSAKTRENIRNLPLSPYRLLLASVDGRDYGNGNAFMDLRYYEYYDIDTQEYVGLTYITSQTKRFSISYGPNVLGPAGDIILPNNTSIFNAQTIHDGEYFILQENGTYCLFECYTTDNVEFTFVNVYMSNSLDEIHNILATPTIPVENVDILADSGYYEDLFGTNEHGIALVKDNRERLLFNYNLQLITDSDRFVLSGYLWQQNKGTIKLATLNTEVNKIINDTIPSSTIINTYDINSTLNISYALQNVDMTNVQALAIISQNVPKVGAGTDTYFIIARNVAGLDDNEKKKNWQIGKVYSSFFEQQ